MTKQLLLSLQLPEEATFANFFCSNDPALIVCCQRISSGLGEKFVYIWGNSGTGRSHLLQAVCHQASEKQLAAMYLSFSQSNLKPGLLDNLEDFDLICVDDLNKIAGIAVWEEALFHLYNRCQLKDSRLIVAANAPPQNLNLQLPDLISRLQSGISFQIPELEDHEKIAILQARAQQRGLELSLEVAKFLLTHLPRNINNLMQALKKLDDASLEKHRKLTLPFVKQILEI